MKAWRFHAFGDDPLVLDTLTPPVPGPGEVRLRMRAASLNYRDLLMVRGHYNPRLDLPIAPLSDGVGVIDAVGPGVPEERLGKRVAAMFAPHWISGEPERERIRATLGGPLDGALAEYLIAPAEGVAAVPSHLDDVEAATLPCAALTAWSALIAQGGLQPGETVLIQGSGGVSIFALQIATMAGARVIATTSSSEKAERLLALGAEEVLNYREDPKWGRSVRRWSGGRGVDHVVEVGGVGTLEQSMQAVRTGGHIALIGILGGTAKPLNLTPLLMGNIRVQGVLVGSRERFEQMVRAFEAAQLRPIVDRVFPFAEAPEAFRWLASGAHFGKVAIRIAED